MDATESKQYPFDLIDLLFMLMAPYSPALFVLCVAQYFLRHNAGLWEALIEVSEATGHPVEAVDVFSATIVPALRHVTRPAPALPAPQRALPAPAPLFESPATPLVSPSPAPRSFAARLRHAPHLALVGATGAGKSTMLFYLAELGRSHEEQVIVLDPHGAPGKWPLGVEVVGAGREYAAIGGALAALVALMQARYEEIAAGQAREGQHPRIDVIADEWRAIVKNVPAAGEQLGALITEARKASIRVILGAHSPYLRGLGLEDSAVRESLLLVFLRQDEGGRYALIEDQRYKIPVLAQNTGIEAPIPPAIPVYTTPDENTGIGGGGLSDADIRALAEQGLSRNKIAAQLGGSKDRALARIKRALGD